MAIVVSRDEFQNSAGDVSRLQLQLIGDVVREFDRDLHCEPSIEFLEFKVLLFYVVHFYLWEQIEA